MAGTRLTYVYTSAEEMRRLFSERAVVLRLDDMNGPAQTEYFLELAEDASDIINEYVENIYDQSDLVNSRWCRIRATWIGCYLLSQRRGNPAQYTQRYQEILAELEKIRLGIIDIPGLAKRDHNQPVMSNLMVDPHYPLRSLRVIETLSTHNASHSNQEKAYFWITDWF
jgi:phage gp36-like protein